MTARGSADVVTAVSTFLFTDIEGSTRLWEEHADRMGPALAQHDRLLRASVDAHGGTVIKTTGDGMLAVFADPVAAIDAAVAAQRALRDATWGEIGQLRVRMALHAGAAEARDGDYFGPALNRVARILAIAHGGQIICSAVAAVLARDAAARRRSNWSISARIACATSTGPSRSTRSSSTTCRGRSRRSAR